MREAAIRLEAAEEGAGGSARLRFFSVTVPEERPARLRIAVRRDDPAAAWLGPHGWQAAPHHFDPDDDWLEGDDLVLVVGPAIVERIAPFSIVEIQLPDLDLRGTVGWEGLTPSPPPSAGPAPRRPVFQAMPDRHILIRPVDPDAGEEPWHLAPGEAIGGLAFAELARAFSGELEIDGDGTARITVRAPGGAPRHIHFEVERDGGIVLRRPDGPLGKPVLLTRVAPGTGSVFGLPREQLRRAATGSLLLDPATLEAKLGATREAPPPAGPWWGIGRRHPVGLAAVVLLTLALATAGYLAFRAAPDSIEERVAEAEPPPATLSSRAPARPAPRIEPLPPQLAAPEPAAGPAGPPGDRAAAPPTAGPAPAPAPPTPPAAAIDPPPAPAQPAPPPTPLPEVAAPEPAAGPADPPGDLAAAPPAAGPPPAPVPPMPPAAAPAAAIDPPPAPAQPAPLPIPLPEVAAPEPATGPADPPGDLAAAPPAAAPLPSPAPTPAPEPGAADAGVMLPAGRGSGHKLLAQLRATESSEACATRERPYFRVIEANVDPARQQPGGTVNHRVAYALCPAEPGARPSATVTRELRGAGQMPLGSWVDSFAPRPGTWASDEDLVVPPNAQPGRYTLRTTVTFGGQEWRGQTDLLIE